MILLTVGPLRDLLQRARHRTEQPGTFLLHPALEVRCSGQVETVQEGTGVEAGCGFVVAGGERVQQVAHVAGHPRVEPKLRTRRYPLSAGIPLQAVERLGEGVPCLLLPGLGPQDAEDPLAGHAPAPRRGHQGQEGHPPGSQQGGRPGSLHP